METDELRNLLQRLHLESDEALRKRFDRSLPFQDGIFDRWERARRLGFGDRASIYESSLVFGDVRVGVDTWVGPFTILDGSGGRLAIGAFCSISSGVHVYTHDTVAWAISRGQRAKKTGPVTIGDCCYIGPQCVVVAGVTVGERCVIGANSFVNRDVPSSTVVAGNPARRIGRVVGEGADATIVMDPG